MDLIERIEVSTVAQEFFVPLKTKGSYTYYDNFLKHYARSRGICLECDDITTDDFIHVIKQYADRDVFYIRIR